MTLEFEKQPRESIRAFAAFRAYLDLGPQRSLAAVAKQLGKSTVLMERWSRRYQWAARIAAHVSFVARIEREAIESLAREKAIEWDKVHEEQRIAEWHARGRMVKLADQLVDRLTERLAVDEKRTCTPEAIARLYELASRLGRKAIGLPSEVKEVKTTFTAKLEIEWDVALRKVYGARQAPVVDVEEVRKPEIGGTQP